MSDAYLIRQKASVFATINVTYPAGSICTCTLGTKVLRAKDTTGTWTFEVPKAGTWVVKAVSADGSHTRQISVSITTKGETKGVTLAFKQYIFQNGEFKVPVTNSGNIDNGYWGKGISSNTTEGKSASCECTFAMDGFTKIHAYVQCFTDVHSKHWVGVGSNGRHRTNGGWTEGNATGRGNVYCEVYVQSFDPSTYERASTRVSEIYID